VITVYAPWEGSPLSWTPASSFKLTCFVDRITLFGLVRSSRGKTKFLRRKKRIDLKLLSGLRFNTPVEFPDTAPVLFGLSHVLGVRNLTWNWNHWKATSFQEWGASDTRGCFRLCFNSCKMSQNVTFANYLHEVNLKFRVNRHYGCEALCFVLSDITRWNTFVAVKIKETVGKKF